MNDLRYLGESRLLAMKEQYDELLQIARGVISINQIKELQSQYVNDLEIEVNGDILSNYKGEEITFIRYDFKNIMVYMYINDNDVTPAKEISLYADDGMHIDDVTLLEIENALDKLARGEEFNHEYNNSTSKYKVALYHDELEMGLSKYKITALLEKMEDDNRGYMPLEFHAENSSAYGFICSSYYEELSYDDSGIAKVVESVLSDWNNESEDFIYRLEDGTEVFMACDYKTL